MNELPSVEVPRDLCPQCSLLYPFDALTCERREDKATEGGGSTPALRRHTRLLLRLPPPTLPASFRRLLLLFLQFNCARTRERQTWRCAGSSIATAACILHLSVRARERLTKPRREMHVHVPLVESSGAGGLPAKPETPRAERAREVRPPISRDPKSHLRDSSGKRTAQQGVINVCAASLAASSRPC